MPEPAVLRGRVPTYVSAELIIDRELKRPPGGEGDINGSRKVLHSARGFVPTPHDGGHGRLVWREGNEFAQKTMAPSLCN